MIDRFSHVTLYVLQVSSAASDWPEREFRDRCWLNFAQALERVEDPGLREVLRAVQSAR